MSNTPIKKKTLFFYGLSDAPVMLASFPMMLYMNKFYVTDMGINRRVERRARAAEAALQA